MNLKQYLVMAPTFFVWLCNLKAVLNYPIVVYQKSFSSTNFKITLRNGVVMPCVERFLLILVYACCPELFPKCDSRRNFRYGKA